MCEDARPLSLVVLGLHDVIAGEFGHIDALATVK